MVIARSAAFRLPQFARSLSVRGTTARAPLRRIVQTSQRRGYSSAGGEKAKESSDIPWAIGAVAVTIPSCWYILQPSGDSHHGGGHGEHKEEHAEEKPAEEEPAEEKPAEEKPAEEKPAEKESQEEPGAATKEASQQDSQEQSEGAPQENTKPEGGKKEQKLEGQEEQKGNDDQGESQGQEQSDKKDDAKPSGPKTPQGTKKVEDDVKGGKKVRIDSHLQKDIGGDSNASDTDEPASAKKASSDWSDTSKKQAGVSNTATRHSIDITKDPTKSKKGEGVAETAKLIGTVKTDRHMAEDKPDKQKNSEENN